MATKEAILNVIKDMKKHLNSDPDYANFVMNGLTFQRMPENKSSSAKLGFVFNPSIDGKTARKGKYFWTSDSFNKYVDAIVSIRDSATFFLKCMEKANPKSDVRSKATKSDHTYDL